MLKMAKVLIAILTCVFNNVVILTNVLFSKGNFVV